MFVENITTSQEIYRFPCYMSEIQQKKCLRLNYRHNNNRQLRQMQHIRKVNEIFDQWFSTSTYCLKSTIVIMIILRFTYKHFNFHSFPLITLTLSLETVCLIWWKKSRRLDCSVVLLRLCVLVYYSYWKQAYLLSPLYQLKRIRNGKAEISKALFVYLAVIIKPQTGYCSFTHSTKYSKGAMMHDALQTYFKTKINRTD